jgi:DNA-binding IclR family transcriptional regulator
MAVRGIAGAAIAAVTVSAPTVRFNRSQIVNLIPALAETTEGIRSDIISFAGRSR